MKMKCLALIMSVLCITAGGASAANYWNNGSGGLWSNAANWNGGVPADNGVSAFVRAVDMGGVAGTNYFGPTIQTGDDFVARNLAIEVGTANSITLTMTGGALTMTRGGGTSNHLRLGAGGSSGTASLNMSGGVITIDSADNVYVPGGNDYVRVGYGYTGQLNMSGDAQINVRDLLIGAGNGSYVDLSDTASIVLKGDDRAAIQGFISNDLLTSNGGTVTNVAFSYNAGTDETTITATSELPPDLQTPYNLSASSFLGDDKYLMLYASDYWSPAGYAFAGSQWQVSSSTDFSAPEWDSGIIGPATSAYIPAGTLAEGNYYGRVRYQGDTTWSDWSETNALDLVNHTIAYWRLDQGTSGVKHAGFRDNWYQDETDNDNDLSAWSTDGNPMPTSDVPFDGISRIGANTMAMSFYDTGNNDIGTFGTVGETNKMIQDFVFTNGWTIECSFNTDTVDGNNMVSFGKDGYIQTGVNEQPFAFKFLPDANTDGKREVRCLWWWDASSRSDITSGDLVQTGKWYSAVATYEKDADTVSFYLKSEDDSSFALVGTRKGPGVGCDLCPTLIDPAENNWLIGRGLRQGVPNYSFRGQVDEVRVSDVALQVPDFIRASDPVPEIGDIAIELAGTDVSLTWAAGLDYSTYTLLEKASLQDTSWSTNTTDIPGGGGSATVTVPADQAQAFFGVISDD